MKPIAVNQKANRPNGNLKTAYIYPAKQVFALLLALLAATIVIAGPTPANLWAQESEVVDRIVAVVNNEIITLYDLNRAFAPYVNKIKNLKYPPEKERQTLFQVRKDVLGQLIDGMLANQQVRRDKITVSQNEINSAIERFKESRQLTDEQMRQGLESQGMTMEEYRKEIEDQILRSKLVNREVKSKIVITKEDIKAYYESHREKYAEEKKYYLWNMYIKVSPSSSSIERSNARNQMAAIITKLKQGRPFETMVDEIKKSSLAVQGTDLGLYSLKDLSEQLRRVVEKMDAGDFSDVLETDFGYQIIYVQKIEDAQAKPFEEVESEIEEILYKELVDNKYQEWLELLRARSHIRIIN
jgi:peptidyl-prolyl cis-trans isomerase SurA